MLSLFLVLAAAATSTQQPMRVGGEVRPPVLVSKVDINFGECVKRKVPVGFPIVEAVIDRTGRVQNPRFIKPLAPCAETAVLAAMKQWRFKPGTYRGKPVAVIYTLTVFIHYR